MTIFFFTVKLFILLFRAARVSKSKKERENLGQPLWDSNKAKINKFP